MKNLLLGLSGLAFGAVLLSGCGGIGGVMEPYDGPRITAPRTHGVPAPSRKRFEAGLKTWVGAPVSEMVAAWGKPSKITTSPAREDAGGGFWSSYKYFRMTRMTSYGTYAKPWSDSSAGCKVSVMVRTIGENSVVSFLAAQRNDCYETDQWPPRDNPGQPIRTRIHKGGLI